MLARYRQLTLVEVVELLIWHPEARSRLRKKREPSRVAQAE
jgi:hypothetical protein